MEKEKTTLKSDTCKTENGPFTEEDIWETMHDDWIIEEALRRMRQELKDKEII